MTLPLLRFINIILPALLAGTSFGIWLGFNPSNFTASTYIEQQQNLVLSLNTLMIVLVVAATVATLISAYIQRTNKPVFIMLLLAAAFFISCMVITKVGNVPIQTAMLKWTPNTLPDNWTMLRDKWWVYHIARTVVELIALFLVAWATVQNKALQAK